MYKLNLKHTSCIAGRPVLSGVGHQVSEPAAAGLHGGLPPPGHAAVPAGPGGRGAQGEAGSFQTNFDLNSYLRISFLRIITAKNMELRIQCGKRNVFQIKLARILCNDSFTCSACRIREILRIEY